MNCLTEKEKVQLLILNFNFSSPLPPSPPTFVVCGESGGCKNKKVFLALNYLTNFGWQKRKFLLNLQSYGICHMIHDGCHEVV